MAKRKKAGERRETLHLGGVSIPVRIVTEYGRRNCRAAVTQRALYIRLPHGLPREEAARQLDQMLEWARKTARQRPEAFAHFITPPSADRYGFSIRGADYELNVVRHALKFHRIVARETGKLEVQLSTGDTRLQPTAVIPKLLAKYFGQQHLGAVTERVHHLNELHFRRRVRQVKMSDTYGRWGSCSHVGNINLATRLLLAPEEVLDAVIIHELAHLVEANHSHRFWAQVARALPDYRRYDEWLARHGKELRFDPVPL